MAKNLVDNAEDLIKFLEENDVEMRLGVEINGQVMDCDFSLSVAESIDGDEVVVITPDIMQEPGLYNYHLDCGGDEEEIDFEY